MLSFFPRVSEWISVPRKQKAARTQGSKAARNARCDARRIPPTTSAAPCLKIKSCAACPPNSSHYISPTRKDNQSSSSLYLPTINLPINNSALLKDILAACDSWTSSFNSEVPQFLSHLVSCNVWIDWLQHTRMFRQIKT